MEITYEGSEITDLVTTKSCVVHDTCGERCDSIEIVFENAAGWYSWGPKEDDQIRITEGAYDSGIMYVNTILPKDGRFRIVATSLPVKARTKLNKSYVNSTIDTIMRACAASSGMGVQTFGVNKTAAISYIEQEHEWCAALLNRLLTNEGAVLKCVNGMYTAIGITYAQKLTPVLGLELNADQSGCVYQKSGVKHRALTLYSPYCEAMAIDTNVAVGYMELVEPSPVMNPMQAGRWARGKLLGLNRKSESITMTKEFDARLTAMARVNIEGGTDQDGEWIADDVEHDLINGTTKVLLRRCISTIR